MPNESPTTPLDYLKEAAEYCKARPEPIGFLEIKVNYIGILVFFDRRPMDSREKIYCSRYVDFIELEQARINPVIEAAKAIEKDVLAKMMGKVA